MCYDEAAWQEETKQNFPPHLEASILKEPCIFALL